jgi:hypothetical protein
MSKYIDYVELITLSNRYKTYDPISVNMAAWQKARMLRYTSFRSRFHRVRHIAAYPQVHINPGVLPGLLAELIMKLSYFHGFCPFFTSPSRTNRIISVRTLSRA